MKKVSGYEEAQATGSNESARLQAGAYLCKITDVLDVEEKEYLKINFDIATGEFKDYYLDKMERFGFWGGTFVRSYKEKAVGFFKGFISAVEKSNPGYNWTWNEQTLIGKFVGLVLGEEEYTKKTGEIGERLYVAKVIDVDTLKKGDVKIPEKKLLPRAVPSADQFADVDDDDDLPFN